MIHDRFGVGVDLVLCERFRSLVNDVGVSFLNRAFKPLEVAIALDRPDPLRALAGRFALKEAMIKALPGTPLTILDLEKIQITEFPDGSPKITLVDNHSYSVDGSIAYEGEYAVGVAIVFTTGVQQEVNEIA